MNNILLLIIGGFGAYLFYLNRSRISPFIPLTVPSIPSFIPPSIPPSGTKQYNQWIQSSLNQIMELNLTVDGIIGPLTTRGIRAFQELTGIYPANGIAGPQTQTAIEQFLEGL